MNFQNHKSIAVLITTSRKPTHFLRRANKVISFSFPNSQKITRGSLNLKQLSNYCFNQRIPRLIILQKTLEKTTLDMKIFSINKKIQLFDITLKLSNIISLQKHDQKSRIKIDKIELVFSNDIDSMTREKIFEIFEPIIHFSVSTFSKQILIINFKKKTPGILIGTAIQHSHSFSQPLYTIHIHFNGSENSDE